MSTLLHVCATCRYSRSAERETYGKTGGDLLADELQLQLDDADCGDLMLRRFDCLMACSRHCVVHLSAPGKMSYVMGDFPPTTESAETLLDSVRKYQQAADGVVPYADWPDGVREHFIARMPPPDQDD